MNTLSIILLLVVATLFVAVARYHLSGRNRKSCCGGCNGNCQGCSGCR